MSTFECVRTVNADGYLFLYSKSDGQPGACRKTRQSSSIETSVDVKQSRHKEASIFDRIICVRHEVLPSHPPVTIP
jgi:hypothetical protein